MSRLRGILGLCLLAFALSVLATPSRAVFATECTPPITCQARCTQIYGAGSGLGTLEDFLKTCTFVNCNAQGYFNGVYENYQQCLKNKALEDEKVRLEAEKKAKEEAAKLAAEKKKNDEARINGKPYTTKVAFDKDVKAGDVLKARRGETIIITYSDGAEVRLFPGGSMKLTSFEMVDLVRGKALFMVNFLEWQRNKLKKKFEVRTSGGAGAVRGTKFQVNATATSATFRVIDGVVEVSNPKGDKTLEVSAGYSVVTRKNGKISKAKAFDVVKLEKELEIDSSGSK
jgi:hypothetical protein